MSQPEATDTKIRRLHATDPPEWWCHGVFDPVPVAFVGIGHPSAARGWPVHECETCGERLFIDYPEPKP